MIRRISKSGTNHTSDAAMAFSWKNRTIAPGETQYYSAIIGVGTDSNSSTITVPNPGEIHTGACSPGEPILIPIKVDDQDTGKPITVIGSLDGGPEVILKEFPSTGGEQNIDISYLIPEGTPDGDHKINIWTTDGTNVSEPIVVPIHVESDKTPPTATYVLNPTGYTNGDIKITITCVDDKSGVKSCDLLCLDSR